jgi:hypothetical protein
MYNVRDKNCIQNVSGKDQRRNLASNWMGGCLPRVLETLIYEGDKLERNKKYWRDICPPCTSQVTPIGKMIWKNKIRRLTRKWG